MAKKDQSEHTSDGWARFWAVLLAAALTVSAVGVTVSRGEKEVEEIASASVSQSANTVDVQVSFSSGNSAGNNAADRAPAENAEAVEAINAAFAAAKDGKAGYDWSRSCTITENIGVGSATDTVNKLIKTIRSDMDLDVIVGKFIGTGDKAETLAKGSTSFSDPENANYVLSASGLRSDDLQNLKVEGDTYTFTLADASNPQRDSSTAFARLTNDFVTQQEIADRIAKELPSFMKSAVTVESTDMDYKNIQVTLTITDGKPTSFSYSYDLIVNGIELNLATATGAAHIEASYKNFTY